MQRVFMQTRYNQNKSYGVKNCFGKKCSKQNSFELPYVKEWNYLKRIREQDISIILP